MSLDTDVSICRWQHRQAHAVMATGLLNAAFLGQTPMGGDCLQSIEEGNSTAFNATSSYALSGIPNGLSFVEPENASSTTNDVDHNFTATPFNQDLQKWQDFAPMTPPGAPYHSPINHIPAITSSGLRHEFRRSISEPPTSFVPHHSHACSEPQMTFNRDGHFIGEATSDHPRRARHGPKGTTRTLRSQPYNRKRSMIRQPQIEARHALQRANTQPVHPHALPPTSMLGPASVHVSQPMQPAGQGQGHNSPVTEFRSGSERAMSPQQEQRTFENSRICTPPSRQELHGILNQPPPIFIDPQLTAPSSPRTTSIGVQEEPFPVPLSVMLSVDELKSIITDAVAKAELGSIVTEAVEKAVASWKEEKQVTSIAGSVTNVGPFSTGSDRVAVPLASIERSAQGVSQSSRPGGDLCSRHSLAEEAEESPSAYQPLEHEDEVKLQPKDDLSDLFGEDDGGA
jgi:hypothetical protein